MAGDRGRYKTASPSLPLPPPSFSFLPPSQSPSLPRPPSQSPAGPLRLHRAALLRELAWPDPCRRADTPLRLSMPCTRPIVTSPSPLDAAVRVFCGRGQVKRSSSEPTSPEKASKPSAPRIPRSFDKGYTAGISAMVIHPCLARISSSPRLPTLTALPQSDCLAPSSRACLPIEALEHYVVRYLDATWPLQGPFKSPMVRRR